MSFIFGYGNGSIFLPSFERWLFELDFLVFCASFLQILSCEHSYCRLLFSTNLLQYLPLNLRRYLMIFFMYSSMCGGKMRWWLNLIDLRSKSNRTEKVMNFRNDLFLIYANTQFWEKKITHLLWLSTTSFVIAMHGINSSLKKYHKSIWKEIIYIEVNAVVFCLVFKYSFLTESVILSNEFLLFSDKNLVMKLQKMFLILIS